MEHVQNSFSMGMKESIPIGLGYLSVAFTFGMACVSAKIPLEIAVLISFTNLTSAGQFAAIPLMVEHASLFELVLSQLVINLRYALMSLSLTQKVNRSMSTLQRACLSFGVTDEIFALASSHHKKIGPRYLFGLMVFPIFCWSFGTFIGGAASHLLDPSIRDALNIAIYGMFIAIIIPPAKKLHAIRVVLFVSIALSCFCSFIHRYIAISSGFVIILCALIASGIGAYCFPIQEE